MKQSGIQAFTQAAITGSRGGSCPRRSNLRAAVRYAVHIRLRGALQGDRRAEPALLPLSDAL
jgi:hypothetical protein